MSLLPVEKLEVVKKYFLYIVIIAQTYAIAQTATMVYIIEEKRLNEKNDQIKFYQDAYFKLDTSFKNNIQNEKRHSPGSNITSRDDTYQ
jgi:hypothetical protein